MMIDTNNEGWADPKKILVILAHPDDPEFFCGAMIARWSALGHQVSYCLLTKGQRGTQAADIDPQEIGSMRVQEQMDAAAVLGVTQIHWMDYLDGELTANLELRNAIVKEIRQIRPDIVVTCDPSNLFPAPDRINHPDHRAAGQVVIDAVFPASGNPGYHLRNETGVIPAHQVEEVWLSLTHQPNCSFNLSNYLDNKIEAILCHRSQISLTIGEMKERFASRLEADPVSGELAFFEKFRRIRLVGH